MSESAYLGQWASDAVGRAHARANSHLKDVLGTVPFADSPTQQTAAVQTQPSTCELYDAQRHIVCLDKGGSPYVCNTMLPCWDGALDTARRHVNVAVVNASHHSTLRQH